MPDQPLLVLYGTETGTAMDLGEALWRECKKRGVSVRLMPFDEYNLNDLPSEPLVIFIVSTSGNGELPSTMRENWRRLLNKQIPTDWLDETEFICFGLGDSSYQKFNFAAKKLFRRLLQLSATLLSELYLADDQHELGPYGLFNEFLEKFWAILKEKRSIFKTFHQQPDPHFPYKFEIGPPEAIESHSSEFVEVQCLKNERVTSEDHFQETRLISFSTDVPQEHHDRLQYEPGDVLMIQPNNLPESITLTKTALHLTEDVLSRPFSIIPTEDTIKLPPVWLIPQPTTLNHVLNNYFDLQMIPKQSFFKTLASFSQNEMEKERLEELYDPQNLDEYLDYAQRPRRTIAETLRDFVATSATFFENLEFEKAVQRLFELFVPIRPRAFSIASSPTAHKGMIQVIVAKVSYRSIVMKEHRKGLCSTFLAQIHPGDKVYVMIRKGTFKFQNLYSNPNLKAICVGPGTGIAPFRSFCAEVEQKSTSDLENMMNMEETVTGNSENAKKLGQKGRKSTDTEENLKKSADESLKTVEKCVVFFGCRNENKDFYFKEDWGTMRTTTMVPAFSRPEEKDQKAYVQDKIRAFGEEIWNVLRDNGSIFVAGRAKEMPDEVIKAIKDVIVNVGHIENPDEFMNQMEKQGRIQFETWD
ncbi:unnamed protein product [Bursaphelenchus okinawaensis]|uniref:NADPH-dependent diflavin oxidoreductase 1 n=1 Tax=Bursaphelenchus okinawaensis TaxID=465554 RepID=A0A811L6U2_9BILA|nr:unnamed protein product [Bursaphelenchus okinawaensis]CAG9117714.1 unnamed protein product [Bursaphelenchus okinawaensis]